MAPHSHEQMQTQWRSSPEYMGRSQKTAGPQSIVK